MKKKKFIKTSILLAVFLLAMLLPFSALAGTDQSPYWTKLIAGQKTQVGDVLVWNDGDSVYVKFVTYWPNCMSEVHVHAASTLDGIPQKNGNPIPGKFDFKKELGCGYSYVQIIPRDPAWGSGTKLYIAAHAVVNGPNFYEETAWGVWCGQLAQFAFPGNNWAAYILYTLE